ncbi:hypothetical protein Bbelb_076320 [Branchiostoma belcheri]|nr:hypothetical protein Bbelb_076320 [Branchiostoma belcheri]
MACTARVVEEVLQKRGVNSQLFLHMEYTPLPPINLTNTSGLDGSTEGPALKEEPDQVAGVLYVHIHSGMDLVSMDRNGLSDPYCIVFCNKRKDSLQVMYEIHLGLITLNPDGTDTKLGHMVLVLYKCTTDWSGDMEHGTARHGMRKHHDRISVSATKTGSHIDLDTAPNLEGTLHGHSDLSLELSRLHQREQRLHDLVTSLVSSLPGMKRLSLGIQDLFAAGVKTTHYVCSTLNPSWESSVEFFVANYTEITLSFLVYDWDGRKFCNDDFLGSCSLSLAQAPSCTLRKVMPLGYGVGDRVADMGSITVSVVFRPVGSVAKCVDRLTQRESESDIENAGSFNKQKRRFMASMVR